MKKRVVGMLMAGAMMLSCFTGMTMSANAANTTDTEFSANNAYSESYSAWRDKTNSTTVYVYPTAGPTVKYVVQGRINAVDVGVDRSKIARIPLGVKGSIVNNVKQNAGTQARLKMIRESYSNVFTKGLWSPDSTCDYKLYQ